MEPVKFLGRLSTRRMKMTMPLKNKKRADLFENNGLPFLKKNPAALKKNNSLGISFLLPEKLPLCASLQLKLFSKAGIPVPLQSTIPFLSWVTQGMRILSLAVVFTFLA